MSQDQPPQASDIPTELLSLLDEELPEEERIRLMARLDEAPEQRAALEEVLATGRLVNHFNIASRSFCPTPDELVRGALGELAGRQSRFDNHLSACPLCAADVADYRALATPGMVELAIKLGKDALELVKNSFGAALEPAPVPVFRGQDTVEAAVGELRVERELSGAKLTVEARGEGEASLLMRVSLTRAGAASRFTTLLFLAGQVIDGRSSEDGAVTIEGLEPGRYELVVRETGAHKETDEDDASALELLDESIVIELVSPTS